MSYVWQLPDTTENALKAYLESLGCTGVVTGRSADDKTLPRIIVAADKWDAPEGMEFSGIANVSVTISVKQTAGTESGTATSTTVSTARGIVELAFGSFFAGDFGTVLSAMNAAALAAGIEWTASGYNATGGGRTYDGDVWTDELQLTVMCAGKTL